MLTQVTTRSFVVPLLTGLLFGIGVPWVKGIEYLDLTLLLPYSMLGLFFVLPASVDAVAAEAPPRVPLAGLFRAMTAGWFGGIVVLWMGIATVSFRAGRMVAPPIPVCLALAVLSLVAALVTTALGAWLVRRLDDPVLAKQRLRLGFLILFFSFFLAQRVLPEDTVVWLLDYLTPEGLVRAALVLAPAGALLSVLLFRGAALAGRER